MTDNVTIHNGHGSYHGPAAKAPIWARGKIPAPVTSFEDTTHAWEEGYRAGQEAVAWQRLHPQNGWHAVEPGDIDHYRAKGQKIRPLYAMPAAPAVKVKSHADDIREEIHAESKRLQMQIAQMQDGARDQGPREYERLADAAFRRILAALEGVA